MASVRLARPFFALTRRAPPSLCQHALLPSTNFYLQRQQRLQSTTSSPSSTTPTPTAVPSTSTSEVPSKSDIPPLQDPLLSYLVNLTMRHGKKTLYQQHIALMLRTILLTTGSAPMPLLRRALSMAAPAVGVLGIKVKMRKFEIPQALTEKRRVRQAWMWILEESEKRLEKELGRRLAGEILNVLEGKSAVLTKTMERHRVAVANRVNVGRSFKITRR